jgi:hypothetical protein
VIKFGNFPENPTAAERAAPIPENVSNCQAVSSGCPEQSVSERCVRIVNSSAVSGSDGCERPCLTENYRSLQAPTILKLRRKHKPDGDRSEACPHV